MTRYEQAMAWLEMHTPISYDASAVADYLRELKASHGELLDYAHRHKEGIVYGKDCRCAYCRNLPEAIKCAESLR